jgi:mannose/cellobiose epimerase-like protein (N-acyl-D-glucosamine 2-epimerase family)
MLEAAVVVPERAEVYRATADKVLDWILQYAWNGEHFEAILARDGTRVEPRYYMVRSDAWVFNAFAAARKHLGDGPWSDVAQKCYKKMESVDFSGPESHASRKVNRLLLRMCAYAWRAR